MLVGFYSPDVLSPFAAGVGLGLPPGEEQHQEGGPGAPIRGGSVRLMPIGEWARKSRLSPEALGLRPALALPVVPEPGAEALRLPAVSPASTTSIERRALVA